MKKNPAIYDAPTQERTDYLGTSRIDPRLIYGFPDLKAGDPPVIRDHPDFPNPRTSAMDDELIDDIRERGEFLEALPLYEYEDGELGNVLILVTGKTRLTAAAREWAENPDTDKFAMVPYVLLTGDPDEIRVQMGLLNLDETRRPLSKLETAVHFKRLRDDYGMSQDKIESLLGMSKRHVTRFLNDMERVLENPEVAEMVQKGDITPTSAVDIVNKEKDKGQQTKIAKTVAQAGKAAKAQAAAKGAGKKEQTKAQGKGEKDARKTAGVKKSSRTTATFPDTLAEFAPNWLLLKAAHPQSPAYLDIRGIDKSSDAELAAFLSQTENAQRFRDLKFFCKQGGKSDYEFINWIQDLIEEDKAANLEEQAGRFPAMFGGRAKGDEVYMWRPMDPSTADDKKTEAPKATTPKATTPKATTAPTKPATKGGDKGAAPSGNGKPAPKVTPRKPAPTGKK